MKRNLSRATLALLLAAALSAESFSQEPQHTQLSLEQAPERFWSPPIDPTPAPDGRWWGSGPDYKIAIDDGIEFFPYVGSDTIGNLPLRWRTDSFLVGGEAWVEAGQPVPSIADRRVELSWGSIIEAYDLREDGVEQTFLLLEAPKNAGDLEIVGRIETPLSAPAVDAARDDLVFLGSDGTPVLRYGAVTVLDAEGRRLRATTTCDGESLTLRVDGEWLAAASYPVLVDPLLSSTLLASSTQGLSYPEITRNDENNRILVSYGRRFAANDYDYYAHLYDDDFNYIATAWQDVVNSRNTRYNSTAYVAGSDHWLLALGVNEGNEDWIELRYRDSGSNASHVGITVEVPRPSTSFHAMRPQLGGSAFAGGGRALLVYERDFVVGPWQSTDATRIVAHRIDTWNGVVEPAIFPRNSGGASYDSAHPSVTAESSNDGWLVAWQERSLTPGVAWKIVANRVEYSNGIQTCLDVGSPASIQLHKITPKISGSSGNYLLLFGTAPNTGNENVFFANVLRVRRVDWWQNTPSPTLGEVVTLEGSQTNDFFVSPYQRALAFDRATKSHWGIVFRDVATDQLVTGRLGYTGRYVERVVAAQDGRGATYYSPSIAYDADARAFPMVYARNLNGDYRPVVRRLAHPSDAVAVNFGPSCGGDLGAFNQGPDVPLAGSQYFSLRMFNAFPNAPTWLYAAAGSANIPLPGHPCPILLNPSPVLIQIDQQFSDAFGHIRWGFPLPENVAGVDIHWQALQFAGGQLWTTNGVRTDIR